MVSSAVISDQLHRSLSGWCVGDGILISWRTDQNATQQGSFSVGVSTDDNGYFSGNVRVCDKDVRKTEERVKVASFSGIWWLYSCLTPQPDATGYNNLQPASVP